MISDLRMLSSPSAAASAYARVQSGDGISVSPDDVSASSNGGNGFGAVLGNALQSVVSSGHAADSAAAAGISGHGNLTQVVMAVSQAQMALQTTTAIRDKVVSAYQDIMKMSI
ncbi:flagellar hook-basal body complex protein FliE [Acetobacteraceae bacterium KSS8]|uniref:Flagellar hook-basal body complex protein FliE n=1 Tax=Endosaccharibacter trunci TaxID=2812733 RepID=A0ABT1W9F5_9PROT|nr:flagellar hook-basal body complex protein FliE [Acetobacteraceae bacterium KSS8]